MLGAGTLTATTHAIRQVTRFSGWSAQTERYRNCQISEQIRRSRVVTAHRRLSV